MRSWGYPCILIVSAILYSEMINSDTNLQDYLLEQQLMSKWERASAAVTPCGEISCILRQCAITKTTITKTTMINVTSTRLTTITPCPKEKNWILVHFPMGGGRQYLSPPCRKRNGQPLNTGTRKLRRTATLIILAIFTLHSEKYFSSYHIRVSSLQGQPSWTTAAELLVGLPSLFDNLSNNHCIIWKNRQTSGPKSYSYPPPPLLKA